MSDESKEKPVTRIRRGKTVVVPPQWVGQIPHASTIAQRQSKTNRKLANKRSKSGAEVGHPSTWSPRHSSRRKNGDEA